MYVGSGAHVNNRVIKTEHKIHNCFHFYTLLLSKMSTEYLIIIDEEYYECTKITFLCRNIRFS